MKSKLIAILIIIFSFYSAYTQTKFPIYSFGKSAQICHVTLANIEDDVIQIFNDSTFSVTNYKKYSSICGGFNITVSKGNYYRIGDTLFLYDPISTPFSTNTDTNYFHALGKERHLKLFPAKIILQKNKAQYISYSGSLTEIEILSYPSLVEIEKRYETGLVNNGVKEWIPRVKKNTTAFISPQLSNITPSF